jgi:hypothetical protein
MGHEEFKEENGSVDRELKTIDAIQRIGGNRMNDAKRTIKHDGTFNRYLLWKEYEQIAMHFNGLIIKLRSQSLGGVAVFATLTAVVARGDTTARVRWGLLTGAFALLSFFWVAVWVLDLGYYNRLLAGAVKALLDIEKESCDSALVNKINLSTTINQYLTGNLEQTANTEQSRISLGLAHNHYTVAFYAIVFMGLLVAFIVSLARLYVATN